MEWAIVVVVGAVLLLFGSKKLPDMARGLGQSMRIFKAETQGLKDDDARRAAPKSVESGTTGDVSGTATDDAPRRAE